MKDVFAKYLRGDLVIWMVCLLLGLISVVAVYSSISSLAYKYSDGNTFHYLIKHGLMLISGFGIMYGMHKINYRYFARMSQIAIWIAVVLLVLTLLLGVNLNDASRWLKIPIINQNFQTSDFAKIALIAYVSRMLTVKREVIRDFKKGLLPILVPIGLVCVLILPANFSTAAMLFLVCFTLLYIGGVPVRHLAVVVGSAIAGFALLLTIASSMPELLPRAATWKSRIMSFESGDSDANYQIEHAMMAIKSGGVLPSGPGTGDSRNYLPHPYSDMIYAFIIEEYGSLAGGCGVVLLYLIFLYRCMKTARKCQRNYGSFLVLGLSFLIGFQAFINIGVAVNLLPVTGQPLPLVSMGGTSIWFTCMAIGMILSVSRSVTEGETIRKRNKGKNTVKSKGYAVA
ncbi:MAG: FtsW/RodA/SpoVE family cell cycle protein [Flavobacteriales bacterium]|nr:FtsW/RodA/SpoVE family cell cycle protein [Flavobacteriales bacterium]